MSTKNEPWLKLEAAHQPGLTPPSCLYHRLGALLLQPACGAEGGHLCHLTACPYRVEKVGCSVYKNNRPFY